MISLWIWLLVGNSHDAMSQVRTRSSQLFARAKVFADSLFSDAEVQTKRHIRARFEENFARATEGISDEAAGRGGNTFRSYDYVNHLVSAQLVGLQLGLELGLGSGLGLGLS